MNVFTALACLFPTTCLGCDAPGEALCRSCRPARCDAARFRRGGLAIVSAGAYEGELRRAILRFKHGRRDGAEALARVLARALRDAPVAPDAVLVPVPATRAHARERGFDQGTLLARALGRALGLPVLVALRNVAGDAQRGRSRVERLAARGRFACVAPRLIRGAHVVLVDDVVTTGATLADCAHALRACGATVARATTVASAPAAAGSGAAPDVSEIRRANASFGDPAGLWGACRKQVGTEP